MRALIVDDELPGRVELRRQLKVHPEVEVVGEASSSVEALEQIRALAPEVVFLDIQLRGDTAFDLLPKLSAPIPHIIFTTAYDEYAVRAFEVNALDYLLKPIEPARLAEALARLARQSSDPASSIPLPEGASVSAIPSESSETMLREDDRVLLRQEDECWFVPVREIRLLESEGNYTRVHAGRSHPLIYRSLNALEKRLPKTLFFRANRSQIINLTCIENVETWFGGTLKVRITGDLEVEISRRQSVLFRERASL
ncbi:MAG TPA: LytTR family DNA-binding domain-containing protein [Candidatus Methylacidiphilales bacterium]|nr:LytTR family DNA-binding domain-containing protein [Candidatus Methylacidiphilales bacterium]